MSADGILNINKPAGETSFDIVSRVRRWSGEKRVGHGGTLDPLATGVLLVCLGNATRMMEFMAAQPKTYRAEVELGITTDSYDISGRIVSRRDASGITRAQVEHALSRFQGTIAQIPPMYSAIKQRGVPLYKLAREGKELPRAPRPVHIYRLEILDWQPPLVTIEVECGKGTYIRSLAYDLGEALGCGACVRGLVRLKGGSFDVKDAVSVDQLEAAFSDGSWQDLLYPMDEVVLDLGAVIVGQESEQAVRCGRPLSPRQMPQVSGSSYCRAYSVDGRLIALLRFVAEQGWWHPEKVFCHREEPPQNRISHGCPILCARAELYPPKR